MENLYEILGVSENSTADEIKKAYRKLAMEHHPDKGGDEEKFKKISEAYDVLGDENKRTQYDNRGKNPFGGFNNMFEEFFNNGFHTQRKTNVPEKVINLEIGAIESFLGVEKTIEYERNTKCDTCNGSGGERQKCGGCNGTGFSIITMGSGFFKQVLRQPCNSCRGVGEIYKKVCNSCGGTTTNKNKEIIKIKLPHGIGEGQFLRLQNKGDFYNGMYGNLILRVFVQPENNFEKRENNLVYQSYLDLSDLTKDNIEIPHPSGKISIKLPNEFDSTKPLRVKSKGYSTDTLGDLIIYLNVRFKRK
jgi:molecular chaperone DnaJ